MAICTMLIYNPYIQSFMCVSMRTIASCVFPDVCVCVHVQACVFSVCGGVLKQDVSSMSIGLMRSIAQGGQRSMPACPYKAVCPSGIAGACTVSRGGS